MRPLTAWIKTAGLSLADGSRPVPGEARRRAPAPHWQAMLKQFRQFLRARPPWLFLTVTAVALIIQLNPDWREALVYDRASLAGGEIWRAWTGHLVHFGWPHFFADAGLLCILGWLLEVRHPWFSRLAFVLMPPFISMIVYWLDPAMSRYGGLSALNLGLLLFLAAQGWRRDLTDWFWPGVLAIYVGEVVLEAVRGGRGGGMIAFDDPAVSVATSAHLAGAAYVVLALLVSKKPPQHPGPPASDDVSMEISRAENKIHHAQDDWERECFPIPPGGRRSPEL